MRLTRFTDYSLRVLMLVASDPTRRPTIAEVAAALDVPNNHLTKVVHFLGQQGWLSNTRGRGGGIALGASAERINVGDVVRAAEGEAIPATCFGALPEPCTIRRLCRLRSMLAEAVAAFHAVLGGYTLADIVRQPAALTRAVQAPRVKRVAVHAEPS